MIKEIIELIKLDIPIEPVPASRPRFTRFGHAYDAPKYRQFKKQVKIIIDNSYNGKLINSSAVAVEYYFYRPVQKSLSKKERFRRINNLVRPIVKPDLDNYVKAIQDCLIQHILSDDNEIVSMHAEKLYSDKPHIRVVIRKLDDINAK